MFLHVESMAQTTRYVAVTGDDLFGRNSCINSETPCRTIMRAVTASSGGDTIMVFGGVYTESIILEKSLTILGEGRDVTVIQSHPEPKSGTGRVIAIVEGLDVGIAYLTIRHGNASGSVPDNSGGGVYNDGSSLTLTGVTLSDNSAMLGGGMFTRNVSPVFTDVVFDGNSAISIGGGVYNLNGSPSFMNVIFNNNSADNVGGGIYNETGIAVFTDVHFTGNNAGTGGGMYNWNSSPVLNDVVFDGNSAGGGGGIYSALNSSPLLTNVSIRNNTASSDGGGMYNLGGSPEFNNVIFDGNSASSGGGMYNSNSTPTFNVVDFVNNTADNGGGMLLSNSDATLRNVRFIENQANGNGGGMHITGSDPALINVLLNRNSATRGGGLYNTASAVAIINGTISDNETTILGGGIYNNNNSALTLTNSIIWNNRIFTDTPSPAQSIVNEGSSVSDISYSLIEHSGGSGENWNNTTGTDGGNNMDLDPMFVDTGDLRLLKDSPAINAGDPATDFSLYLINLFGDPLDLDGNRRLRHNRIDMGAYEYQGDDIPPFGMEVLINNDFIPHNGDFDFGNVIVDENASFLFTIKNNGSFQLTLPAFGFDSVNASEFTSNLASASLAPGGSITGSLTFSPEDLGSRAASLTITANDGSYLINLLGTGEQGPVIQPAIDAASDGDVIIIPPGTYKEAIDFKGKAIHLRSSDGPEATIIDATGLETSVVSFTGGEGPGSILEGFTITGGIGTVANPLSRGGGIYIIDSSPTIRNCIITGNSASAQGGGMFNIRSNPVLNGVIFSENTAVDGGGMFNRDSSPLLEKVIFDGNTAENGGGMSNINGSAPVLSNVSIINNTAQGDGGGMSNGLAFPSLNNVTFDGNTAINGGAIYNNNSSPILTSVMISGNRVNGIGGGMYNENSTVTLTGSVFLGNYADEGMGPGGGMYNSESIVNLTNVTFSGNRAAIGGAMYNVENSNLTLSNVIIWNNMAENNSASPFASIANGSSSISTVSYSLLANSGGSGENWNDAIGVDGGNNIDTDPMFVQTPDPLDAPASNGDVRLLPGSPAINAGDPDTDLALFPAVHGLPTDPDGNPRVRQDRIDMGAYEFQGLAAPQLVSPADGEEIEGYSVTLGWYSVADADSYSVQVSLSGESFEYPHFTAITSDTLIVVSYLDPQTTFYWRVKAHNNNIVSDWSDVRRFTTSTPTSAMLSGGLPTEYLLHQNYPNPFNPTTVIRYEIPAETYVLLEVYNMLGQRVVVLVDGQQQAGYYTAQFQAESLPSGLYMYRITAGKYTAVKKLMLVR